MEQDKINISEAFIHLDMRCVPQKQIFKDLCCCDTKIRIGGQHPANYYFGMAPTLGVVHFCIRVFQFFWAPSSDRPIVWVMRSFYQPWVGRVT